MRSIRRIICNSSYADATAPACPLADCGPSRETWQAIDEVHDADIVTAVHVLYFWRDPINEIRHTYRLLRPGGLVALGYQLARDMPAAAQRDFPATGHRLVEDDSEVEALVLEAGFASAAIAVLGNASGPAGRLLLATRS